MKSRRFRDVSWSDFWWLWPTLPIVALVGALIGVAR